MSCISRRSWRGDARDFEQGLLTQTIDLEIEDGSDIVQDITFDQGCSITGTVTGIVGDNSGEVVALQGVYDITGWVTVEDVAASLPQALDKMAAQHDCDADGRYLLQNLPPGTYTLIALSTADEDFRDIQQWRWLTQAVTLKKQGDTQTVDFDFK